MHLRNAKRFPLFVGIVAVSLVVTASSGAAHFGYFQLGHDNDTGPDSSGLVCELNCLSIISRALDPSANTGLPLIVWQQGEHGIGPALKASTGTGEDNSAALYGEYSAINHQGAHSAGVVGRNTGAGSRADDEGPVTGFGVLGIHETTGDGVRGASAGGNGVSGYHAGGGDSPGVLGYSASSDPHSSGVLGLNSGPANSYAVAGASDGAIGVLGQSRSGIGILGYRPNGYAGYFVGNVHVQGTLSKSAGSFRIDNPQDPSGSYLQHSFVESPDMLNVYSGTVVTGKTGIAAVQLPAYFQALNRDFRYQLTLVGRRGWRARVVQEIAHNRFTIESDEPGAKVSWQVTGVRHDPYAEAHRIQVVVPKTGAEAGRYLAPELYGQPASKSMIPAPVVAH